MGWLRRNALRIYAGLAVLYMLIPIVVIVVFSFAETPKDKLNFAINNGFTLEYWQHAFALQELNDALRTSLGLAALATLSPEHRAVVVMRYTLEYTPGEIAAVSGVIGDFCAPDLSGSAQAGASYCRCQAYRPSNCI